MTITIPMTFLYVIFWLIGVFCGIVLACLLFKFEDEENELL